MKLNQLTVLSFVIVFGLYIAACENDSSNGSQLTKNSNTLAGKSNYDAKFGEGKFKDVVLDEKLNESMADAGNKTFTAKCAACHKLTEEKLVGPGWKGVTSKRLPAWILNFITNTDEMINKDPEAQAQLEICLVRMPNQSLSDDDARSLLEFMRKNDGVK